MAAVPDRPPPVSADRARADPEGRLRARPARRGACPRARPRVEGGRSRGDLGVLSLLVRQPRARAARGRDRAGGVSRGVPLGLVRGAAAVPGVRALLDRLAQRLHRAEGLALHPPARGGARGAGGADEAASDDVCERRRHTGRRRRAAGESAHVRSGRRRGRRHLGRQAGGVRQRDHARRRRHLGRHRAGPGRASCG